MLEFCVLSSGSKANCVYIRSGETRVLVDCGLSSRETTKRLRGIGVEPDQISAVVVSHEHNDHVTGVPVFARSFGVSVYANQATFGASRHLEKVSSELRRWFFTGEEFSVGDLRFEPFSVLHDAADPVAFRVTGGHYSLAVVTDLGQVTNLVRERTADIDAIVLESNHDPVLLKECPYPWELKRRIAGRSGHLSNETAGELLEYIGSRNERAMRVVVAAHISEQSNDPVLAVEVLRSSWKSTSYSWPQFLAADVYNATPVYSLGE